MCVQTRYWSENHIYYLSYNLLTLCQQKTAVFRVEKSFRQFFFLGFLSISISLLFNMIGMRMYMNEISANEQVNKQKKNVTRSDKITIV
jgi:hypothetical protein